MGYEKGEKRSKKEREDGVFGVLSSYKLDSVPKSEMIFHYGAYTAIISELLKEHPKC